MTPSQPLRASLEKDALGASEAIVIGNQDYPDSLQVSFQRTVRVPDDTKKSDLPPGLGAFPLYSVSAYEKNVPSSMACQGGIFFPMYRQ